MARSVWGVSLCRWTYFMACLRLAWPSTAITMIGMKEVIVAKREQPTIERIAVAPAPKIYGTPAELALMYGMTVAELKKLRHLREGPPYRKLGRQVFYSLADFAAWFEAATVPHEADPSM